jgi:hypothetical protein
MFTLTQHVFTATEKSGDEPLDLAIETVRELVRKLFGLGDETASLERR